MQKLFACYLGGRVPGCHIEMHDVQFSVGENIEDCYQDLQWKSVFASDQLHIDAFLELKYIDGYEVILSQKPKETAPTEPKLWFVNAGGYDPRALGEMHEIGFYIAQTSTEATQKALQVLCDWQDKRHRDDIYDVDDCIAIEQVQDYYISLIPTDKQQDFVPMYYGYGTFDKSLTEKIVHHNY